MNVKVDRNLRTGKTLGSICDLTLNPSEKFDGWDLTAEQAEYLKVAQAVTITLLAEADTQNVEPRTVDGEDDLSYDEEDAPNVDDNWVGYKQFNGFLTKDGGEISFIIDNDRYLIDCDEKSVKFDENYHGDIKNRVKVGIEFYHFTDVNNHMYVRMTIENLIIKLKSKLYFDGVAYSTDDYNHDSWIYNALSSSELITTNDDSVVIPTTYDGIECHITRSDTTYKVTKEFTFYNIDTDNIYIYHVFPDPKDSTYVYLCADCYSPLEAD